MSTKAKRLFQERLFIENTLHKSIDNYSPTGDDDFDSLVRQHLQEDASERSESFILSLYDIARDMTFTEWQDFWFDMGIRIFDVENEWNPDDLELNDYEEDEEW